MAALKHNSLTTQQFLSQIKALIFLISLVLLIGTLSFMYLTRINPTGAFILTIETLAGGGKSGNGELLSIPGTNQLQIGLHLLGAIIIWFAIWTSFGLAVEGKFGEFFKE